MVQIKITTYLKTLMVLAVLSFGLASCLKETSHPPLYGWSTPNVISFQDNGGPSGGGTNYAAASTQPYPLYQFSFDASTYSNNQAKFSAIVIYGPGGNAPQDITLNVAVDTAALNAFNDANSTGYEVPDPSVFSFPSTVTIKKGETQAYIPITLSNSASFDFSASYAIPLTITSSSYGTISPNFGSEINSIVIKNKYDGHYGLRIETDGWGAFGISDGEPGDYPGGEDMVTAGANSVSFYTSNGLGNLQPALTAGNAAATGFGATTPLFTFDPSTDDLISVVNTTPDDGRGRTLYLDPSVTDSRYDPSTGTIYAAYIMTQNGRSLMYIRDTLTYQGPR